MYKKSIAPSTAPFNKLNGYYRREQNFQQRSEAELVITNNLLLRNPQNRTTLFLFPCFPLNKILQREESKKTKKPKPSARFARGYYFCLEGSDCYLMVLHMATKTPIHIVSTRKFIYLFKSIVAGSNSMPTSFIQFFLCPPSCEFHKTNYQMLATNKFLGSLNSLWPPVGWR